MKLLKFIGTTALTSVENGYGDSLTVNPGDYILVAENVDLEQDYPSQFELVKYKEGLRQVRVEITSAELLALNTTPKELVSAPGAGYYIDVDSISATVDYNSAAYATNTTLEFRYTNGSGDKVTADIAGLLTLTADGARSVKSVTTELTPVANAPVVATVATGDPVTGDSPIYVTVNYRVLTLP